MKDQAPKMGSSLVDLSACGVSHVSICFGWIVGFECGASPTQPWTLVAFTKNGVGRLHVALTRSASSLKHIDR